MKERGVARFGVWIVFGRGYNLLEAKQYCLEESSSRNMFTWPKEHCTQMRINLAHHLKTEEAKVEPTTKDLEKQGGWLKEIKKKIDDEHLEWKILMMNTFLPDWHPNYRCPCYAQILA